MSIGIVHVLDVALAHILALENSQAQVSLLCAVHTLFSVSSCLGSFLSRYWSSVFSFYHLQKAWSLSPDAQGRYVCANVTMSYMEMAKIIQEAHPELARNMPTRTLPNIAVKACLDSSF